MKFRFTGPIVGLDEKTTGDTIRDYTAQGRLEYAAASENNDGTY